MGATLPLNLTFAIQHLHEAKLTSNIFIGLRHWRNLRKTGAISHQFVSQSASQIFPRLIIEEMMSLLPEKNNMCELSLLASIDRFNSKFAVTLQKPRVISQAFSAQAFS